MTLGIVFFFSSFFQMEIYYIKAKKLYLTVLLFIFTFWSRTYRLQCGLNCVSASLYAPLVLFESEFRATIVYLPSAFFISSGPGLQGHACQGETILKIYIR